MTLSVHMCRLTCREDIDHISRLHHLLELQYKHLILVNKFGASSKNLAVLAGIVSDHLVHLIDSNVPDAKYKEIFISTYIKVAAARWPANHMIAEGLH